MIKQNWLKRLLAVALSLTVAVTFVPLLGDSAFAEGEDNSAVEVGTEATDAEANADADLDNSEGITVDESTVDAINDNGDTGKDAVGAEKEDAVTDDADAVDSPDLKQLLSESSLLSSSPEDMSEVVSIKEALHSNADFHAAASNEYYSVSATVSGNKAYVKGSIPSKYQGLLIFGRLFVDNTVVKTISDYSFSATIDMSSFSIGYHTVYYEFYIYDSSSGSLEQAWDWTKYIPSSITETPNYNGRFYYVYSNYFDYYPFNFGCNLSSKNMYMEYSSNGGATWQRTGSMKANAIRLYMQQGYSIGGLAPNTVYSTRLCYGTYATYSKDYAGDGKTYFFSGPARYTDTIKTGVDQKPKVKSVKVKAVKVKKHKVRHYGYFTGVYLYTEKYYTYKLKVTVKLKKKPGTAGLWINGNFVSGNKKKYTTTLPGSSYSTKKPRGKKYTVGISSYQNAYYGGLSPLYQKTKKIK